MRLIDGDKLKKDLLQKSFFPVLVAEALNKCELVDAEPVRHGRWKGSGMGDYYCSLCSEEVSGNYYPYCPNCGAKMDEVN